MEPKSKKAPKKPKYTLKDNALHIPGVGTVKKEDFNADHFSRLMDLPEVKKKEITQEQIIEKYLVLVEDKDEEIKEEGL